MSGQKCSNCKKEKALSAFPFKRGSQSERIKTCEPCQKRKAHNDAKRAEARAEAAGKSGREKLVYVADSDESDDDSDFESPESASLSILPLDGFLAILRDRNDALHVEARVDLSDLDSEDLELKDKAKRLSGLICDALG